MSAVPALVYDLAIIRWHALSTLETAFGTRDCGLVLDLLRHPASSDPPRELECGHIGLIFERTSLDGHAKSTAGYRPPLTFIIVQGLLYTSVNVAIEGSEAGLI